MLRDTSPMIIHTTNPPAIPVQMWLNSEVLILLLWELTQLDKERKEQTFIPTWYRFSRNACYLKYAVALYSNHFSLNRAEHLYVSPAHWRELPTGPAFIIKNVLSMDKMLCHLHSWSAMTLQQPECIHGILTLLASSYIARLIICTPLFSRIWVLTVTTMCDFEMDGANKPTIGSSWNNGKKELSWLVSGIETVQWDSVDWVKHL